MFANHPEMAKRWLREYGQPKRLPGHVNEPSDSNESPAPKLSRIKRKPGVSRDFGGLHPSQKARMKISHPANLVEAESEGHGVQHHPGSYKPHLMKLPEASLGKLARRDVRAAERR